MSLNEMLTELRHEARLSTDVSHGKHLQTRHIALLRRVQEEVYSEYDWPALKTTAMASVSAGTRFTTYPDELEFEGINAVYAKSASDQDWRTLTYGIGVEQLNSKNSHADERGEDLERWQNFLASGAEQVNTNMLELWPIPSEPASILFEGTRALKPLKDVDTDHSTIDGMSVVLHAAAEILAGQKAEDAGLKLQKAVARVNRVRAQQSAPDNRATSMFPSRRSRDRVLRVR